VEFREGFGLGYRPSGPEPPFLPKVMFRQGRDVHPGLRHAAHLRQGIDRAAWVQRMTSKPGFFPSFPPHPKFHHHLPPFLIVFHDVSYFLFFSEVWSGCCNPRPDGCLRCRSKLLDGLEDPATPLASYTSSLIFLLTLDTRCHLLWAIIFMHQLQNTCSGYSIVHFS